jgi:hypothetical protein
VAISSGFAITFLTLLMGECPFRLYPSWRCLGRLLVTSVVENLGFRQMLSVLRARACWRQPRGHRGWGEMIRAGFGDNSAAELIGTSLEASAATMSGS